MTRGTSKGPCSGTCIGTSRTPTTSSSTGQRPSSSWGAPGSTVVFYGYAPAMGFWLMKLYGHADVRILDCARGTWQDQGRPWTTDAAKPVTSRYRLPDEDERIRAHHSKVEDAINDPACTIVDVRTASEFRGRSEERRVGK